jgi:aerobic-type carbon monoxide dehydrogenase small subunit (CoxS/CutS family)
VKLRVNGEWRDLSGVDPSTPLLWVLRESLGLTGTKYGCGLEQCGACAVLCDGKKVLSCAAPVSGFDGREIVTVEGLARGGELDPLQRALVDEQAAQCGYCLSGILIAAEALFAETKAPSDGEIRAALASQLCRCGAHPRMLRALRRVSEGRR